MAISTLINPDKVRHSWSGVTDRLLVPRFNDRSCAFWWRIDIRHGDEKRRELLCSALIPASVELLGFSVRLGSMLFRLTRDERILPVNRSAMRRTTEIGSTLLSTELPPTLSSLWIGFRNALPGWSIEQSWVVYPEMPAVPVARDGE